MSQVTTKRILFVIKTVQYFKKLGFSRRILFQVSSTKFPKNPSGGRRVGTCKQKDRPTGGRRDMRKLIGAFRE